jgi:hypothetical protein
MSESVKKKGPSWRKLVVDGTALIVIFPTTSPGKKDPNAKRYRVEVEVDDPAEPDETAKARAVEVTE